MPLHPAVKAAFAAFRAAFAEYRAGDAEGFEAGYEAAALLALRAEEEAGEEENAVEEENAGEEENAREKEPVFLDMTAAHLRQWVEANPGRVNDVDRNGYSPLSVAAKKHTLSLVVWLLDKGEDIPVKRWDNPPLHGALHRAWNVDIITALLDRGADPVQRRRQWTPLMRHSNNGFVGGVARLLRDSRVRATINLQSCNGRTALHMACFLGEDAIIHLLLQAGANPALRCKKGFTPLDTLRSGKTSGFGGSGGDLRASIALLEQAPAAEKTSILVKARQLVAMSRNAEAPSYLRGRVLRGLPLPRVALAIGKEGDETGGEGGDECWKFRGLMAFVLAMEGGPQNTGMPRDVFRGVFMDLLMPSWDPLRVKRTETALIVPRTK